MNIKNTVLAFVIVMAFAAVAEPANGTGVYIDGESVCNHTSGYGWRCEDNILTLTGDVSHNIYGTNTNWDIRIVVDCSPKKLTLWDLSIAYPNGVNAITFTENATNAVLVLRGTNTIYGVSPENDTYEAICVDGGAKVTVKEYEGGGVLCGGYDGGGDGGGGDGRNYRGVWVRDGGTLVWEGGTLSSYAATIGQTGGGIAIAKGGSVTVAGGMITNCYCDAGGGAIGVRKDAHFLMTGGMIVDCRSGDGKSHFVYNERLNKLEVFAGGTFYDDPLAFSWCANPVEHYRVHKFGEYYQVLPPICLEPVYNEAGDPASGISHWKTNVVAVADCVFIDGDMEGETTWTNGWYVVDWRYAKRDGRITCEGDVHLILQDDTKLTAAGGIGVAKNARLTIYAQENGTGALTVCDVAKGEAGIGDAGNGPNGPITIHGGNVDVVGGADAAGIGCSSHSLYGAGENITINGGRVFAKGSGRGAGIGGGEGAMASNIVINAGTVMAAGGTECGAAIGGGSMAPAYGITINGGSVRTRAHGGSSFIGGDGGFVCHDLRIAREATLVFSFDPNDDSLRLDYPASTIVLPKESILSSRSLVDDAGDWKGPSTFALTNVGTHATGSIAVGGEKVAFETRNLEIPAPKAQHPLQLLVTARATDYLKPKYVEAGDPKSGVSYWETATVEDATFVASSKYPLYDLQSGWYVVEGDVTIAGRVQCRGDVHLVLMDGATLTVGSGIAVVPDVAHLTVYGQAEGTGKLISRATVEGEAGIGGTSTDSGGNLTINGGTVEAYGAKHASGIGGGKGRKGQNIVVNGGTVTATGGAGAAGIGGGYTKEGDGITINGGTVMATGGAEAAGIGGGGEAGKGKNILINGGTVTAIGSEEGGTGIGGGKGGAVENINLNGGTIRPVAAKGEAFIGNGISVEYQEAAVRVLHKAVFVFDLRHGELAELTGITNSTVIVPERPVPHVLINGLHLSTGVATNWTVRCPATGGRADIAPGDDPVMCGPRAVALSDIDEAWDFSLQVFGAPAAYRVPVYNEEGDPKSGIKMWEDKIHSSAGLKILNVESNRVWKAGWYVVESDFTLDGRITCDGEVHLIVPDGVTFKAPAGIRVLTEKPNSLAIYSGHEGTGHFIAIGDRWDAAIGGEFERGGGNVTINGGTVEVYGGSGAAAIGGGYDGSGTNIVINAGTVKAIGGRLDGAGLGGGHWGAGESITINGGYVMSQGGKSAAAIGGGYRNVGRDITLNAGTVVVTVKRAEEGETELAPALIGSAYGAASPMGVRISKDVILVYDLLREHERVFMTTYTNSTLITRDVSNVQFAEMGAVPDAEGKWTGTETFLVTNVDTHATAKIKVNAPAIDWGDKKVHLAYRPTPGSLMLCPATDYTGVFVNGAEVGPEYSAEAREKMGWWYDKANKVVHIENGGDFRITGCNVDGSVRFLVDVCAHVILDHLTLVYPGYDSNAFTIGQGTLGARATLVGTNHIYGHAVYAAAGESEPDQEREAVFRVSNGAVLTVYDGGNGALNGNYSPLYCATWVCRGGQLFWSGGTAMYYHTICWSFGSAVCQCGIFDHHPIESKVCGFELGKHSQIKEIDGLFYVYSYWYEAPVYRTEGDPKSGIDRWETNILDWAQCVVLSSASNNIAIGSGWRVVDKYCRIEGGIWYEGDVRLLVTDGATLSIAKGLNTTNDASRLTIYGQGSRDGRPTGKIVCNGGGAAAIGGIVEYEPVMHGGDGNNITINGCEIEATVEDGGGGAVIGGHFWHGATNIVINGGLLNLSAGYARSAIIGGAATEAGLGCEGRDIVINGGTINDLSPHGSAGIGCARNCGGAWPVGSSNLVVNGGSINASVGDDIHKPSTTLYKVVDTNNVPNVGPLEIAGLGTYGVRDIFPAKLTNDVSQLTFYLPEPAGTYWVDGVCHAYRNGGATDAKPYSPDEAGPFDTEEEARAYAATAYVPRPNPEVEGVVSAVDYGMMFKFVFREGTNAGWYAEPALKDDVAQEVTEAIESETVTALLAASVTNDVPKTVLWTRAGLYYGIGGSTDVKDVGEVPNWLLGDGGIQTLEGAKPAAATDKAFYRIRVTPQP